jgi:hypothetical protein
MSEISWENKGVQSFFKTRSLTERSRTELWDLPPRFVFVTGFGAASAPGCMMSLLDRFLGIVIDPAPSEKNVSQIDAKTRMAAAGTTPQMIFSLRVIEFLPVIHVPYC